MVLLMLLSCQKCFIEFPKGYTAMVVKFRQKGGTYRGGKLTRRETREAPSSQACCSNTVAKDDAPLRLGACRPLGRICCGGGKSVHFSDHVC